MSFYKLVLYLFFSSCNCFDYEHENYILSDIKSFAVPKETINLACSVNHYLNFSKFFDTKFIIDFKKVQQEISKDPSHKEIILKTADKQQIECSFFDRKKNNVIVIGPGFTNAKEKMIPFVHMFDDFDILIINFRGHGVKKSISFNPIYHFFGIDTSLIKLGLIEENDVFASLEYLRSLKKYEKVIGLGVCFGAFVFAKAQGIAEQKGIQGFDKLILDGCWKSLNEFVQKIKNDPYLIIDPQRGGASHEVKWIFSKEFLFNSIISSIESLINIEFNKVNICDYLNQIKKTPILFFYSKNDLTISRNEFEYLWNSSNTDQKLAFITSNPHVRNHLKIKEIYKLTCQLFIEKNQINEVIELLADPEKLGQHLLKKFQYDLQKIYLAPLNKNKEVIDTRIWPYISPLIMPAFLYVVYKSGRINTELTVKLAKFYGFYKLIQYCWRPTIKLISKI